MNSSEKLGYYRKASGISQLEAAERLDVARQTIGRWEQGVSSPSMENLVKLSELYGVPVDALVKDDWVEEKPPEVQFVEVPVEVEVPIEVPVPRPRNYRLWAVIAAVLIAAGITVGALLFREPPEDFVPISETESEVPSRAYMFFCSGCIIMVYKIQNKITWSKRSFPKVVTEVGY